MRSQIPSSIVPAARRLGPTVYPAPRPGSSSVRVKSSRVGSMSSSSLNKISIAASVAPASISTEPVALPAKSSGSASAVPASLSVPSEYVTVIGVAGGTDRKSGSTALSLSAAEIPGAVSSTTGEAGTATPKTCCAAWPPGSVAVTATRTAPRDTDETVTTVPDTETVATARFEEAALNDSAPPSGSVKYAATSTSADLPSCKRRSGMSPTACGARSDSGPSPSPHAAGRPATTSRPSAATMGRGGLILNGWKTGDIIGIASI